jgi:ribosomal protein L3 glutamine methyltransferase
MNNPRPPSTTRTVRDFVLWGERLFSDAGLHFGHGTDNALDEAAWLVAHALGLAPDELTASAGHRLDNHERTRVVELFDRRVETRKPAAYLTQQAWFAGLPFYVDERVIVPRSHIGEFISERFEPWLGGRPVGRALDLCSGGGCIAIALARTFADARVDAVDISADALAVARVNVEHYGLAARVRLVRSDLWQALGGERYDLVVSNPPYVPSAAIADFPPEYRHEPELALAGGSDGLDVVRRILGGAHAHLAPGGILVVEVGDARDAVEQAFPTTPFVWPATSAGTDSVFVLAAEQLP